MTDSKILSGKGKDWKIKDQDILDKFVRPDGTCRTCGKNHQFRLSFENIATSIDAIPLLLQKVLKRERLEKEIL